MNDSPAAKPGPDAGLAGQTVLLVEDEPHNVIAMKRSLTRVGCQVLIAENGAQALEVLGPKDHGVDLVLMDSMMPVMDGLTAISKIRTLPHLQKLPIISLTARAMPGDREKCLAAGADDYFAKPVNDLDSLLACMRQLTTRPK